MRVLLDTHVYLWWLRDDPKLSSEAREVISDPASIVHVSAATIWEAAIKQQLRRLDLHGENLVTEIEANGFVELPVAARHGQRAGTLPLHHRDPFDRMLIAQAEVERLVLITHDRPLERYGVDLILT